MTRRYIVTTVAGREESLVAASPEAARLARLDQLIAALELAERQGKPRRFDGRALPKEAREDAGVVVGVSDLYLEEP
jgi:hypothetical protein